ncbi:uncharacterized protein BXZ73DRAFT_40322 [Epithele typhae]|uniref:uncharacterized protein n=1 Tax=Epithele typhae TaxID=378194 RepID=UPI0020089D86|nr:uncharacterized protein BXZ73DRAFT_40322 [Epithele typhae]KAH9943422.1 hypothetical protein BXZ73DRAFT_40322 [Epithele typhae]
MKAYSPNSKGKASGLAILPPVPGSPPARSKSPSMPPPSPPSPRQPVNSRSHTYGSTNSLSVPATPFYSPQVSSVNVLSTAKRLLVPTVRPIRHTPASPRIPPSKPSPSKLGRTRTGSLSVFTEVPERAVVGASDWISGGEKFEIVEEYVELGGCQIYAVEKWVVARKRPVLVVTVYTGDPRHKITVTALSPSSSLPPSEAQIVWDEAVRNLRRDGARPKETEKGILMVTSLANFRSDYTIVHIPSGNFLDVRDQLYANIDILRMGLGGRSALTLEEPSDATKDRFIALYHVTDKAPARSRDLFNSTILELVKVIQASLAIFGMFEFSAEERNGLLCDVTCDGIQRWVAEIGEPYLDIELSEKVADPTVIAALFSLILSTRSRLHALGYVVPRDPFLEPLAFVKALAGINLAKSHSYPHLLSHPASPIPSSASTASSSTAIASPTSNPSVKFLSQALMESIKTHYEKARQSESYKVHRVLKNKFDGLTTDLRTTATESGGPTATSLSVTSDLAAFARNAVTSKDAPPSLRYLWTGRPGHAEKKRREKEAVWSDGEREDRDKDKIGEKESAWKDGREKDERDREKDKDGNLVRSGDEGERPLWSGRMQRKIESWAALKGKKLSVDFGTLGKAFSPESPRAPFEKSSQSPMVPSVVVSREPVDEEDMLSSGQQSPVSDTPNPLMLGVGTMSGAERSASELSEYDRRVSEFNLRRPPGSRPQSRIISWSDTRSARGMHTEQDSRDNHIPPSPLGKADSSSSQPPQDDGSSVGDPTAERRSLHHMLATGSDRRRSFDDAAALADAADDVVLPVERMRIDVELCGQLLVARRREAHLANVAAVLAALAARLAAQNAGLHADHELAREALALLAARAGELPRVEALRAEADALAQETHALAYESEQFQVGDLLHMAAQPRARVLALREKAFGTGRRLPQGVRGAHGPFSHVQWTLDGEGRLVDRLGRTESEAEEEEEGMHLPGLLDEPEGEEVDAVEHQNLKPTWLLRFFNYWGGRLVSKTQESPAVSEANTKQVSDSNQKQLGGSEGIAGQSTSVGLSTNDARSHTLHRTITT